MAAEDILQEFLLRQVGEFTSEVQGRPVQADPVKLEVAPAVPIERPSEQLGLPQPISEIPLGMVEQPDTSENILQEFLQRKATTQQIVEQPPEEKGFFSRLKDLFTGEDRATPETEAAPELTAQIMGLGQRPSLKEFVLAGRMLLTATDEEKRKLIEETVPDASFRTDEKGNTFVTLPGREEAVLNRPGFSLDDALNITGMIALFTPAGRVAKGLAFGAKTLIRGGVAAATEIGRQVTIEKDLDPVEIGLAGATGVVGEVVAPAARAIKKGVQRGIRGARRLGDVTPIVRDIPGITPQEDVLLGISKEELPAAEQAVRRAREVSERTGFTIAPAQQLGDPQALRKQRLLAELSPSAKEATAFLRTSNKEVFDEVERVLDVIAPPTSVETAPGKIRSAAEQAIEVKKTIRAERAAPIYDEAKRSPLLLKLPETKAVISEITEGLPETGKIRKRITGIERLITGQKDAKGVAKGVNTRVLHEAKLEIDDMISKFGEGSLGNTEKQKVIQIQQSLLKELDAANPLYKEARKVFAENSPAVDELKNSIIGKISKLDDIQIERVGETLFKPGNNVSTIIKAKKVIESVDPQAWRDITRSVFETRLGNLKITKETAVTQNVPAQVLRTIFGNNKQQKILFAGVDTETAKNLRWLKEGLELVKEGRPGGSETAGRLELIRELTRTGAPKRTVLRAIAERPVKSLGSIVADVFSGFQTRDGTTEEAIGLMGKLYFNPKWQPRLAKIRKLKSGSPAAAKSFLKLLEDVGKPSLQVIRPQIEE